MYQVGIYYCLVALPQPLILTVKLLQLPSWTSGNLFNRSSLEQEVRDSKLGPAKSDNV